MVLFSKEKDLIHRLTNLVLVIWFIIAVVCTYVSLVNLIFNEPTYTFGISGPSHAKSLMYALGNVVIVGAALYFLNKKRD